MKKKSNKKDNNNLTLYNNQQNGNISNISRNDTLNELNKFLNLDDKNISYISSPKNKKPQKTISKSISRSNSKVDIKNNSKVHSKNNSKVHTKNNSKVYTNNNSKVNLLRNPLDISYSNSKERLFKITNNNNFENTIINNELRINTKYNFSLNGIVGLTKNNEKPFSINAIVQCLSNVKRLRNFLIKGDIFQDLLYNKNKDKKVSFALAKILKNIWENNNIYDSTQFKTDIIKEMKELKLIIEPITIIKNLLSKIHEEFQKKDSTLPIISKINSYNFNEVNDSFMAKIKKNNSIITTEFYGHEKLTFVCNHCKIPEYEIKKLFYLNVDLEKVIKNTKQQNIKMID